MKSLLTERVVASPQPTVVDLVWLEEGNTPPSDSVLDRALPELLRLSENEIDQLWESLGRLAIDDLALSDATLLAMRRPYLCAEDSLEILVSSAIGYLQSLFLSDSPFDEFLEAALAEISARVGRDVRPSADSLSSQSFISGVAEGFGALPLSAIPGTDLLESCLGDQRVHRIGDLSGVSESSLFRVAGFGALTLRVARMCWSLREELIWLSGLGKPPDGAEPPRSLCDEMRLALSMSIALAPGGSREKAIRVVLRRLGVESGSPMTLEEAASAFGLTRQRIRQIEAKAVNALDVTAFLAELVPLRVDIFCTLAAHGWGMLTAELARDLADRRGWADSPSVEALEAVTAMLPECDADSAEEVVLLAGAGCSQCDAMAAVLDEITTDGSAIAVSEVRSRLVRAAPDTRRECAMCAEHDPKVFAALLDIALEGQVDLVRNEDGWLLPHAQSGRRPNSLAFRAQDALRRSGRCMHFREVAAVLAKDNPTKAPPTPRNVYAALERVPDAVSWDAGSFIHKECMPFPYQVVRGVEEWITERFNSPAPPQMLSVHGVYQRFEGDCVSHGVPSELALYSLLRMSGEPSLVYPQYPQIHWQVRGTIRAEASPCARIGRLRAQCQRACDYGRTAPIRHG